MYELNTQQIEEVNGGILCLLTGLAVVGMAIGFTAVAGKGGCTRC